MLASDTLNLSIGDVVPDSRLTASAVSGEIKLLGKRVNFRLSADAIRAAASSRLPIVAQMELYFSCLVRKQLRFIEIQSVKPGDTDIARLVPGFYTAFQAITTAHCRISATDDHVPTEQMPIKDPHRFVPDWIKIDYRAGKWRGEYGFSRNF